MAFVPRGVSLPMTKPSVTATEISVHLHRRPLQHVQYLLPHFVDLWSSVESWNDKWLILWCSTSAFPCSKGSLCCPNKAILSISSWEGRWIWKGSTFLLFLSFVYGYTRRNRPYFLPQKRKDGKLEGEKGYFPRLYTVFYLQTLHTESINPKHLYMHEKFIIPPWEKAWKGLVLPPS